MVLIAQEREKVLRLPLRSYRLYNRLSQFRFDNFGVEDHVFGSVSHEDRCWGLD